MYYRKPNKYRNVKVKFDGIIFDSKKEMQRYQELKLLEKAGKIKGLELQPVFELIPTFKRNGKTYRRTTYKADFKYFDVSEGKYIIEDVKSSITANDKTYRVKIKMFIFKYPDINFKEVIY